MDDNQVVENNCESPIEIFDVNQSHGSRFISRHFHNDLLVWRPDSCTDYIRAYFIAPGFFTCFEEENLCLWTKFLVIGHHGRID